MPAVLGGVGGSSEVARLATSAKVAVSSPMKLIRLLWWAMRALLSSTDGYDAELRGDMPALGSETPAPDVTAAPSARDGRDAPPLGAAAQIRRPPAAHVAEPATLYRPHRW